MEVFKYFVYEMSEDGTEKLVGIFNDKEFANDFAEYEETFLKAHYVVKKAIKSVKSNLAGVTEDIIERYENMTDDELKDELEFCVKSRDDLIAATGDENAPGANEWDNRVITIENILDEKEAEREYYGTRK